MTSKKQKSAASTPDTLPAPAEESPTAELARVTVTCVEVSDWPSTDAKTNERVVLVCDPGGPRAFDAKLKLYVGEGSFGTFAKGGVYDLAVIGPRPASST